MVQICVNAYVTFLYSGFSVFRLFRILALDVFRILVLFVLGIVSNPYMLYLNHLVSLGSTSACMHLFCTVRVFFPNCQIPYDVRVICLPNVFHLCHVSCTFFVFLERPLYRTKWSTMAERISPMARSTRARPRTRTVGKCKGDDECVTFQMQEKAR